MKTFVIQNDSEIFLLGFFRKKKGEGGESSIKPRGIKEKTLTRGCFVLFSEGGEILKC
jgi:hypothetical protein